MMIFIWAHKYFIWINELKTNYSRQRHPTSQYITENQ